jgi:hypothetical protein
VLCCAALRCAVLCCAVLCCSGPPEMTAASSTAPTPLPSHRIPQNNVTWPQVMAEVAMAMALLDSSSGEGAAAGAGGAAGPLLLQAHLPLPLSAEEMARIAAVPCWDGSWRSSAGPSYRDLDGLRAAGRSRAAWCLLCRTADLGATTTHACSSHWLQQSLAAARTAAGDGPYGASETSLTAACSLLHRRSTGLMHLPSCPPHAAC